MIHLHAGVAGYFQIETAKADHNGAEIPGTRRVRMPWRKNLITDAGLDRFGTTDNYIAGCQVGSGNAAPVVTDTALQSLVATTTTQNGDPVRSAASAAPYYAQIQHRFRFAAGAAAGVLAEVGITMNGSSDLYSRSLIKDEGGDPVTIEVLSDEILDVVYRHRWYPPASDATGTVTVAGVSRSYVVRGCTVSTLVGAGGTGGYGTGWGAGTSLGYTRFGMGTQRGIAAFDGTLGAVTSSPGGTAFSQINTGITADAYSPGSFTRTYSITYTDTQANFGGGISALRYAIGPACFQMSLSPPVAKTSSQSFTMQVRISWGRYEP